MGDFNNPYESNNQQTNHQNVDNSQNQQTQYNQQQNSPQDYSQYNQQQYQPPYNQPQNNQNLNNSPQFQQPQYNQFNNNQYQSPQYIQPQYKGQSQYQQPYNQYQMPSQPNYGMAVASMICGIVSIVFNCCIWYISLPTAIVSFILGILSIKNKYSGKGMAIAGIVLSSIVFFAFVLFIIGCSFATVFWSELYQELNPNYL